MIALGLDYIIICFLKLKKYSLSESTLTQEGYSSNLMASSTALQLHGQVFVAFANPVSVSFG